MIYESVESREAALSGRVIFLGTGTGTAAVQLYESPRPATPGDAPTTPMLASIALNEPAGTVIAGALVMEPTSPATVAVSGTPTWARVVNRDGDVAFDMDAGPVDSGAECILSQSGLVAGSQVAILSAILE
jgi:hypothetical protein